MHVGHQTMGNGWQHNNSMMSVYILQHQLCHTMSSSTIHEIARLCHNLLPIMSQSNKNQFYKSVLYMQEI